MTKMDIINAVSEATKVSREDMMGRSRKKPIADARHICVYVMFLRLKMNVSEIGREVGRDYKTVMHSVDRAKHMKSSSNRKAALIGKILNTIDNQ